MNIKPAVPIKSSSARLLFCLNFILLYNICNASEIVTGRKIISLNGHWQFKTDDYNQGIGQKWFRPQYPDNNWEKIAVPGNWDLKNKYAGYKGKAWYRKKFIAPAYSSKRASVSFEAVGMGYKVFLNGHKIAEILSGNTRETIDITGLLLANRQNTIAVETDNSLKWGAYWGWGGIRRSVEIFIDEPVTIERQEIVSRVNLSGGNAAITTRIIIRNTSTAKKSIKLHQLLRNGNTISTRSVPVPVELEPNSERTVSIEQLLEKNQVKLWHFDHPDLYTSEVSLWEQGKELYQQKERFGIRKIEIVGNQLKLNGETVRLAGYNWVADDRTTGSTLPAFRYKQDIDLMKAAGANIARLSHRPLPQDVMDYLDEKGILVIAEFNNWPQFMNGTSNEPKEFAKNLIQQNFNHPSVFGWSVGNENGNLTENPQVNEYVSSIIKYIKTNLDSSRLVTYASHTADIQDNDAAQFCDIILINRYGNHQGSIATLEKRYPAKAIFMSEYGSHSYNLIYETPDKTLLTNMMVDSLKQFKNLIGYSMWTFNDYRSNYQTANAPTSTPLHQNRQWGIVDVYRNKKRSFGQMQDYYAPVAGLKSEYLPATDSIKISCSIQPRAKQDIPAFILKGYKLVWEIRNSANISSEMGAFILNDIHPGDNQFNCTATIKKHKDAQLIKWSLLSPTGYIVKTSIDYLAPPPVPEISGFIVAGTEVRVLINKNSFSEEYQLSYTLNNKIISLPATINHYIDISGLPIGQKITCSVTGKNGSGVGQPSEKMEFITSPGYKYLPPVIWQSEPTNNGFFVGYSYHFSDNQYELRYGTDLKDTATWQSITTGNFGMMEVPDLLNHKQYYYQLRRFGAFNNTATRWSEIKSVTPNPNHQYGTIQLHGYRQTGDQLVISLTPSSNEKGFSVICNYAGYKKVYPINQSAVELIHIRLENSHLLNSVEIKAQ
jgi:beta-galactosidase